MCADATVTVGAEEPHRIIGDRIARWRPEDWNCPPQPGRSCQAATMI